MKCCPMKLCFAQMKLRPKVANALLFRERIRANRHLEMRKALFLTKLRKHPTPHKDVTSEQPSPLGWLARNRTAVSVCHPEQARVVVVTAMQYGIFPRASKFCFLKLPIVFGYAVPFAAISKKQNRKGSPQSLIYPLKGKLTSFVIKQFFTPKKVHQTLMRSRLRRVCFVRYAHLRKTSTCAEMTAIRSHRGYNPRVLRMTS